jgi:hypothetical protein
MAVLPDIQFVDDVGVGLRRSSFMYALNLLTDEYVDSFALAHFFV